jgi:hypothetical protein
MFIFAFGVAGLGAEVRSLFLMIRFEVWRA